MINEANEFNYSSSVQEYCSKMIHRCPFFPPQLT